PRRAAPHLDRVRYRPLENLVHDEAVVHAPVASNEHLLLAEPCYLPADNAPGKHVRRLLERLGRGKWVAVAAWRVSGSARQEHRQEPGKQDAGNREHGVDPMRIGYGRYPISPVMPSVAILSGMDHIDRTDAREIRVGAHHPGVRAAEGLTRTPRPHSRGALPRRRAWRSRGSATSRWRWRLGARTPRSSPSPPASTGRRACRW